MKTVGIVACSRTGKRSIQKSELCACGVPGKAPAAKVIFGNYLRKERAFSGTGKEPLAELMKFSKIPKSINLKHLRRDLANQILEDLDYEVIRRSRAVFWGYSDLTTVINAIYARTGKSSVLYSIENLVRGAKELQRHRFEREEELFRPDFRFVRGESMEGIVIGGNIRCFLKLAGTRYFPDVRGKVLLLESFGGEVPQMVRISFTSTTGRSGHVSGILLIYPMDAEKAGAVVSCRKLETYTDRDRMRSGTGLKRIRIGNELLMAEITKGGGET